MGELIRQGQIDEARNLLPLVTDWDLRMVAVDQLLNDKPYKQRNLNNIKTRNGTTRSIPLRPAKAKAKYFRFH